MRPTDDPADARNSWPCCPATPSCTARAISRSCKAPRIRKSWPPAPPSWAMQPWPSPTSAAWPAWCARTWRQRSSTCRCSSAPASSCAPRRRGTAGPDPAGADARGLRQPVRADHAGALARAKGEYRLAPEDFTDPPPGCAHLRGLPECLAILTPEYGADAARVAEQARWLARVFPRRAWVGLTLLHRSREDLHRDATVAAAREAGLPLVALGQVQMHLRSRQPLHDTLAGIRSHQPVSRCGYALAGNAERHLRTRMRLASLYPPEALAQTLAVARRCGFAGRAALRVSGRDRAAGPHARHLPAPGDAGRRRAPLPAGRARGDRHADRERAGPDPRPAIRGVFPDRLRHRPVRARPGHPVPGPGLGRQLGRLLLPGHHRGRPDTRPRAVRALHQQGAQRTARHRRGLRAPAPRGSDPVHLRQVWPRPRRADRGGHLLSTAQRAARHRPRAWRGQRRDRRGGARAPVVGRQEGNAAHAGRLRAGPDSRVARQWPGWRRR